MSGGLRRWAGGIGGVLLGAVALIGLIFRKRGNGEEVTKGAEAGTKAEQVGLAAKTDLERLKAEVARETQMRKLDSMDDAALDADVMAKRRKRTGG